MDQGFVGLKPEHFARVNVVGPSGGGKSTFGRVLAGVTRAPYVEMDAIFWSSNWQPSPDDIAFARLREALGGPRWVLDGNFDRAIEIKWKAVTMVVWIDYSFSRVLWQALCRAVKRIVRREEIWPGTGNRETIGRTFFSRDSILLWTIKTYGKLRRRYAERCQDPRYARIRFVRLRGPGDACALLETAAALLTTEQLP